MEAGHVGHNSSAVRTFRGSTECYEACSCSESASQECHKPKVVLALPLLLCLYPCMV